MSFGLKFKTRIDDKRNEINFQKRVQMLRTDVIFQLFVVILNQLNLILEYIRISVDVLIMAISLTEIFNVIHFMKVVKKNYFVSSTVNKIPK